MQAACPFHRKSDRAACKKLMTFPNDDANDCNQALGQLFLWCNRACDHARQWRHLADWPESTDVPTPDLVRAGMIVDLPSERPMHDVELDEAEAATSLAEAGAPAAAPPPRGRGRGRRGGRGRGRGRGRRGRRGRGAASASSPSVGAAAESTTSSSSSSRSSSDGSSDSGSSTSSSVEQSGTESE